MTIESVTGAVIGAITSYDILAIIVILLLFAIFWTALRIIRKEKEIIQVSKKKKSKR